MDQVEFQKILFKSAMCVMACDGEIHDSEVAEMEIISQKTSYFNKLDYHKEIAEILNDFSNDNKKVLAKYFLELEKNELSSVQKLQLLEIVMRIIHADDRIDPNEIKFLQLVKYKLAVHDEIFFKRFGEVSYLTGSMMNNKVSPKKDAFIKDITMPDFSEIQSKFLNVDKD